MIFVGFLFIYFFIYLFIQRVEEPIEHFDPTRLSAIIDHNAIKDIHSGLI